MIAAKRQYTLSCVFLFFSIMGFSFAAAGFEYIPDEATLGLWHLDGGDVADTSDNAVKVK